MVALIILLSNTTTTTASNLTWWERVQAVVVVARVIEHCGEVPVLGTGQHLAAEEYLDGVPRLVPPRSRLVLVAIAPPAVLWTEINRHPPHRPGKLHAPLRAVKVLPANYRHVGALTVAQGSVNVLVTRL